MYFVKPEKMGVNMKKFGVLPMIKENMSWCLNLITI